MEGEEEESNTWWRIGKGEKSGEEGEVAVTRDVDFW
jgi:hypothetical protein